MMKKGVIVVIVVALLLLSYTSFFIASKFRFTGYDISGGLCITDYTLLEGNLVQNPYVECDKNSDGLPDNWTKGSESVQNGKILSWVNNDDHGYFSGMLKSEHNQSSGGDSFGWWSNVISVKPDTWYEFSYVYADDGIEPTMNISDNTIEASTNWMGVDLAIYNVSLNIPIQDSSFWAYGPNMTDWNDTIKVFRTYSSKGFTGWKSVKSYIQTPKNGIYIKLKTYNYPKGKIYADNFTLKEVPGNYDPSLPPLNETRLEFMTHNNTKVFPIILYGTWKEGGKYVSFDRLRQFGFNSIAWDDRNYNSSSILDAINNNLLFVPGISSSACWYPWNCSWKNDPNHTVNYIGWNEIKRRVDFWINNSDVILAINTPDEKTSRTYQDGMYIPNLKMHELIENYSRTNLPNVPLIANFGDLNGPTGLPEDTAKYYFPYNDIHSFTFNSPQAYYNGDIPPRLASVGRDVRKTINLSHSLGLDQPTLAFGLGCYWWSDWDGRNRNRNWKFNQIIPFNLQRFQVWDQIINGATGAWFWSGQNFSLEDYWYNYSFRQITTISKELASLSDVLLEPVFYNEWNINDSRIDAMMKKHNGKIYLLTASTSYDDLYNINISIDTKYKISSVKAINEVSNGNISNVFNRTVQFNGNSFLDNYTGENISSPQGRAAPGYAVHIYEINYDNASSCGDGVCNSTISETCSACPQDCGACSINQSFFMTSWPIWIDAASDSTWLIDKAELIKLKDIGYTHAGVSIYYLDSIYDPIKLQKIKNRVQEIRDLGMKIAIERAGDGEYYLGHQEVRNGSDPQNHSSNGLNSKYLDSPNLKVNISNLSCSGKYNWFVIDPSYKGILWNNSIENLKNVSRALNITNGDIVYLDLELWTNPKEIEESCTPDWIDAVRNSTRCGKSPIANPNNNATIAYDNYIYHWRNRGLDLKNAVKEIAPNAAVIYFGENTESFFNLTNRYIGYMPPNTGDVIDPVFYTAPNLTLTSEMISQLGDVQGASLTTSFTWNHDYIVYDPKITQKMGYLFKNAGFMGAYEWPGVGWDTYNEFNKSKPGRFNNYLEFLDYYNQHAAAFVRGFRDGIDISLTEICRDGIDNDGDMLVDELGCSICGDSSCDNGETCSSCQEDCGTCQTNPTTSGGGGGGGGTTLNNTIIIIINEKELLLGLYKELGVGDVALFDMSETPGVSEKHSLSLTDVSEDSIDILVQSSPQAAKIKVGYAQKFELDGDGYFDIKVSLNSIRDSKAFLGVRKIVEDVVTGAGPIRADNGDIISPESGNESGWTIGKPFWISMGIAIFVVGLLTMWVLNRISKIKKYESVVSGYISSNSNNSSNSSNPNN